MKFRKASPGALLRFVKRFWPQIKQEKKLLAVSVLGLVGEVSMRLLEPWPLKFVIDGVLEVSRKKSSYSLVAPNLSPLTLVTIAAVAVLIIGAIRALSAYANTVGLALVGSKVLTRLRSDLYAHMQSLSLTYHARARSGELMIRVINDVGMLKDVAVGAMLPFVTNILMVTGMFAVMFWLDWRLAAIALSTLPLFWLRTTTLTRRLHHVAREQRRREGAMAATAAESISAIRVVKALSLEAVFQGAFSSQNDKSYRDGAKATRLEAGLERTVDALIALSSAMVLWYGARLALNKAITPGALVVFLTYLKNAFRPVRDFAKYTGRLSKAAAAGQRVLEVLDEEPGMRDRPDAVPAPPLRGSIRFESVRFSYTKGCEVLSDVNFEVRAGERVAIVGESGAGKSTIASLALRLYDPDSGRVLFDDTDVRAYTIDSLRAQTAVVLQDTLLFAGTVAENIAFGAPDVTPAVIERAARLARADDFIRTFPGAYDTPIGERGVTVSSGQRQRIAIARAAVRQSPVLVLDEPTTGLDEENRVGLIESLEVLSRGRTTLIITHDLSLALIADQILVLDHGVITESGSHAELLAANGRYASMYRSQSSRDDVPSITRARSALIA